MPPKRKRRTRSKKGKDVRESAKEKELRREIKLSGLNTKRYRRLWREMLMRIKMPDIERNVEITWQTLEHVLDLKDYSISLLLDGLREGEDQRRRANGVRTEAIDRSLRIHQARLQTVDTLFHRNLETVFIDNTREFRDIDYYRDQNEATLRRSGLLINCRNESMANIATSTTMSKINAFVDDGQNERRLIATQLQKLLEEIWDNLRNIFLDYRKSTEERRKAYETIRRKDEFDRKTIIRQGAHVAYLLEEIARFRERIQFYRIDATDRLRDIGQESDFIHDAYREANRCFTSGRKKDKDRAMTMSKVYGGSVKYLNALVRKAERMLLYIQICRKYETQDEKILPPVVDCVTFDVQPPAERKNEDSSSFDLVAENSEYLTSFWHRLGFARLITAELRMERDRLTILAENLRNSVKRHLGDGAYPIMQFTEMEVNRRTSYE